jgi:hypothetical protein
LPAIRRAQWPSFEATLAPGELSRNPYLLTGRNEPTRVSCRHLLAAAPVMRLITLPVVGGAPPSDFDVVVLGELRQNLALHFEAFENPTNCALGRVLFSSRVERRHRPDRSVSEPRRWITWHQRGTSFELFVRNDTESRRDVAGAMSHAKYLEVSTTVTHHQREVARIHSATSLTGRCKRVPVDLGGRAWPRCRRSGAVRYRSAIEEVDDDRYAQHHQSKQTDYQD